MKTNLKLILFMLAPFFFGVNYAAKASYSLSNDDAVLYKYNLVNASTYTTDSGFDASTPIANLWNGSTAEGVNNSKASGNVEAWVEFDFGQEEELGEARLWQDNGGNRVTDWKVMYWTGNEWKDIFPYKVSNTSGWQNQSLDVKTSKVRFYAKCTSNGYVSIHEIWLFTKLSPEKRKTVIGCAGDSNTAGAGTGNKDLYSWPAQLGQILGSEFEVKNLGVAGTGMLNESTSKPWVNTSQYSTHKEMYANISIIALGTNDSKAANWKAAAFTSDYLALINEFKAYPTKPEVYILIPIKAFSSNHNIVNKVIDEEIRPILRDISKTYAIPTIDGYSLTENMGGLVPDGIHPNAEGLGIIAEKIASILLEEKPVIRINGTPVATTYAEYRWYKDGVLQADASQSTFTATEPGTYKVAVKLNATTDDVIVSESFDVTEANVNLVVSDPHATGNTAIKDNNTIKVTNLQDALWVENAAGEELCLYDISGKIIKTVAMRNNSERVAIAHFSNGLYIYKVGEVNGKITK